MKTSDTFRLALLFLARRKMRTFLTILGVIIGTVCIVLMLSIGISNYQELQEMIESRSSLTEIQVMDEQNGLTAQDASDIEVLDHVAAASPILQLPGRLRTGVYEAYVQLTGVYPEVLELRLEEGEIFSPASGIPQLVIGGDATRDFIDPANPPSFEDWTEYEAYEPNIDWLNADMSFLFGYGSTEEEEVGSAAPDWLEDPGTPVTVRGVTERSGTENSNSIYLDFDAARGILMENAEEAEAMSISLSRYPQMLVRVDSMDNVETVLSEIRDMGFEAVSDIEYINETRADQGRQLMQLLLIGLISLLVSAIGIANTMYAGILERRRDIGVMKVLGMKRARIQGLFVTEAACIGTIGGLIGLAVSWIFVQIINASMASGSMLGMYFAEGSRISIPLWIGGGAVLVACCTGILAGLLPAAKASRMSALEAMRNGR